MTSLFFFSPKWIDFRSSLSWWSEYRGVFSFFSLSFFRSGSPTSLRFFFFLFLFFLWIHIHIWFLSILRIMRVLQFSLSLSALSYLLGVFVFFFLSAGIGSFQAFQFFDFSIFSISF